MTAMLAGADPFGLLEPTVFTDPYGTYHLLRHADPVHYHPLLGAWVLTRYADVVALLADPALVSSQHPASTRARLPERHRRLMATIDEYLAHWILDLDPPVHTPLRRLFNQWFTGAAVAALEPRIRASFAQLLGAFVARGGGDFVAEVAHPFPVGIIADMVGVPAGDRARMLDWFARLSQFFERGASDAELLAQTVAVIAEIDEWAEHLVAARRREPRDDVVSELAAAAQERGVAAVTVRAMILLMLFAGHESSRSVISSGLLALLEQPEQLERLRADPGLVPTAVEELLRYEGAFMRQNRVALQRIVLPGGREIAAGEHIFLVLGAANRDPAQFFAPDRLIVDRRDNRHVAFGHGIHFCLGARLARAELRIAFEALAQAPPMVLCGRGARWRPHFNNRGLAFLDLAVR